MCIQMTDASEWERIENKDSHFILNCHSLRVQVREGLGHFGITVGFCEGNNLRQYGKQGQLLKFVLQFWQISPLKHWYLILILSHPANP